jgi:epoxyqueuosine reductase
MSLSEDIKQKGLELGFDLVGITDASPIDAEQVEFLAGWLKASFAGQMNYMHRNFEKRMNPAKLLENAKSVICLGLNYARRQTDVEKPDLTAPAGRIANYAQYEDYHLFMKKQLRKLTGFISSSIGTDFKFKICVDSAPLAERALAVRAGLGFIGKNHMLIITEVKLQTDEPSAGTCSQCNKCVDACPTGALRDDGQFDANRCISYLTIELKGQIPAELAEKIGDRLFGCDECVLACPYQKEALVCKNKQFRFYDDRAKLNLTEVLSLSSELFEGRFGDSVIKRLGLEQLKRNAKICLGNAAER